MVLSVFLILIFNYVKPTVSLQDTTSRLYFFLGAFQYNELHFYVI